MDSSGLHLKPFHIAHSLHRTFFPRSGLLTAWEEEGVADLSAWGVHARLEDLVVLGLTK